MRGLGINFRVRIQFGQALSRINLWIRETPLAAAAAAAAAVQADGQTAHWLHGENHCWVLAQVLPSINEATLLPTCHLHQLCVDAPREGPGGPVRGGGLFLEQHAWTPHGPLHSRAPSLCLCLFTAAPLAFAYASASFLSCLSLCSFSWSLSWAASLSARDRGSKNGLGVHNQGTLGA